MSKHKEMNIITEGKGSGNEMKSRQHEVSVGAFIFSQNNDIENYYATTLSVKSTFSKIFCMP